MQQYDAGSQDEQCAQEDGIRRAARRRIKQDAAEGGNQETANHAAFIADFFHQLAGGNRHQRIRGEEAELHQHGLRIAQVENAFQVGNQDIVHAGDEAHHEKQRG